MIKQESISFTQIRADLMEYIASLPEENRWNDQLASTTGLTVIELLAGFGAFITFKIMMGQREMNLATAQLRSAVLGISETLGYSAMRGMPATLTLLMTTEANTTFSRFQVIGTYDNLYDIVVAEDRVIATALPTQLKVLIGNRIVESTTISTVDPIILRFNSAKISDFCRLLLNDAEVTTTDNYIDLLTQQFIMLTNPMDGVDVFSLNNQSNKYAIGDTLALEYVEYASVATISGDKLVLDSHIGELLSAAIAEAPEDITHIKISAPVKHETQSLIKGRQDYIKLAKLNMPSAYDVNSRDVSPAIIELCFLPASGVLPTAGEKTALLAALEFSRPFGIPPVTIVNPKVIQLTLPIQVKLLLPNTSAITIAADIATILRNYEYQFEKELSLDNIEADIEKLAYMRTVRVALPTPVAATFVADAVEDILTVAGDWIAGTPVRLTTTGTLPAPLQTGITYYVFAGSLIFGDAISLSEQPPDTEGFDFIPLTDIGTGVHTVTTYPEATLAWNEYAILTPEIEVI